VIEKYKHIFGQWTKEYTYGLKQADNPEIDNFEEID
jgi:hypothetical protein